MILTPSQELLARNAAQRVLLHGIGLRPDSVALPLDELECLCLAAAPALNLDPLAFDTGKFHAPSTPQSLNA